MKKKSILKNIIILMVVTLGASFTIVNFCSIRTLVERLSIATGQTMEEIRADEGSIILKQTVIATGMGIIVIIILCWVLYTMLIKPLIVAVNEIEEISNYNLADGENSELINKYAKRPDEVGIIARSVVNMKSNLKEVVNNIASISETLDKQSAVLSGDTEDVLTTSNEISKAMNVVTNGAVSQVDQSSNNAAEMQILGEKIEQNKALSDSLVEQNEKMNQSKDAGMQALNRLVEISNESSESINGVRKALEKNVEKTTEIDETSKQINEIAEQTNLLALNASIEAARAGEAGKGFAVVADQIGTLSVQTNTLTQKINEVVKELVETIQDTVTKMNLMEESFEQQQAGIQETHDSFQVIETGLNGVSLGTKDLRGSIKEMENAKKTVLTSMEELSGIAQDNAASSQEVNASVDTQNDAINRISAMSQQLTAMAAELDNEAKKFII